MVVFLEVRLVSDNSFQPLEQPVDFFPGIIGSQAYSQHSRQKCRFFTLINTANTFRVYSQEIPDIALCTKTAGSDPYSGLKAENGTQQCMF